MRSVLEAKRVFGIFAVLVTVLLLLSACGSGDTEEQPAETSAPADAQPTVVADETETPDGAVAVEGSPATADVPSNVDMSAATIDATPLASAAATPVENGPDGDAVRATRGSPSGTPDAFPATPVPGVGTPVAGPIGTDLEASPEGSDAIAAAPAVGDGTTGANVLATPGAGGESVSATPVPGSTDGTATPGASPVASASPAAPMVVTGCDVASVPAFDGEQTIFTLTTDLNFRTGPGADCDLADVDPIGAFQAVEVIGGPVIREDEGSEWVQIRALGTGGWVAFEFLEPVEE